MISSRPAPSTYRQTEYQELCERCRRPAVFRCRACGATFCAEHVEGLELCAACTAKLHAIERGSWVPITVGQLLGWLGWLVAPEFGAVGPAVGTFLGMGISALIARRRRARLLASGEVMVQGAKLPVARGPSVAAQPRSLSQQSK